MLKKLNLYFTKHGRVVSEREYAKDIAAPYRLATIDKFLGGWHRMVYFLGFYYPQWKADLVVPSAPEPQVTVNPLDALTKKAKKEDDE
jgi:hypothetical protein